MKTSNITIQHKQSDISVEDEEEVSDIILYRHTILTAIFWSNLGYLVFFCGVVLVSSILAVDVLFHLIYLLVWVQGK